MLKPVSLHAALSAVAAALLLSASPPASAGSVTLHFDAGGIYRFARGLERGFGWQNTPIARADGGWMQGHWDLSSSCIDSGLCGVEPEVPFDYDFSPFLGTDPTGCRRVDAAGNALGATDAAGYPLDPANYVSECGTPLRLDRGGLRFDVLSFIPIAGGGIHSSKGGSAFGEPGYLLALDGDAWKGVEWILMEGCDCGSPAGIDELTIEITEPALLAMLGVVAVAGRVWGRRRRR